ncbi:hypothetical protein ACM8AG_29800, partial [Pseudomonas aeruginosa]|uniref:hypothetical protein n=1 Tax=Enterobacter hormaechei TaxID=158836 RepID=UPI003AE08F3B
PYSSPDSEQPEAVPALGNSRELFPQGSRVQVFDYDELLSPIAAQGGEALRLFRNSHKLFRLGALARSVGNDA